MTSAAMFSALCLWTSYTTNTAPPSDALPVGFYHLTGDRQTSPLYIVRQNQSGGEPFFGWQRTRHVVEVHGVRGFTDVHISNTVPTEILTCNGLNKANVRWVRYHPWTELSECLPIGKTKDGEKIYLARVYVNNHPPARAYLPARFIPSSGLAITEHYGTYATDEFKLFCNVQT